ncbi:uncharacterized protein LOC129224378 [Uloborus diversus]|uniref:uncharacterized protein LOC129224378 n=1 Tax=Uloborus diversus TaxID=327109 RepID=UPI0024092671|nr:uncharacterized protein LOC129224378 [Uloborus diversus]
MKKIKKTKYNDSEQPSESWTNDSQDYRGRKRFKKEENVSQFSEIQTGIKNRSPESKKKNSDITESIVYYERILKELKKCLNDDSKELFSQNVLKESENKEVELCCHKVSSHCIEVLLPLCKDEDILQRFMAAFAQDKETVCTDPSASHITELLIKYSLQNVKNWNPDFVPDDANQESKLIMSSMSWLTDFADFIHENFSLCLTNVYSCHVANTLIRALGGDLTQQQAFMSKNSQAHKRQFYESYVDEDNAERQCSDPVILENVPKFFLKSLKRLAKALMTLTDIEDYVTESAVATVIEALLVAVKKRLPKRSKKLILCLAEKIFQQKNQDGIPFALLHKNSSYIIEEMFKAADEEVQHQLWEEYMGCFLSKLVVHPIGNYIVQRLFDTATNAQHFETMCQSVWNLFDEILNCRHYGIFVSIANACVRLKVQQAQFMKNIMQCLHCLESEERQLQVVPLLLGFKKYEQYIESKTSQDKFICLQGSLVSQAVLKFHKPIKVVNSLLNMKPQDLVFLACHIQGCHVLNSYFAISNNVGEKNKDKLLNHLKPAFVSLICDRNGSFTLSRIWTLLSIKQKEIVMRDIIMNEKKLQQDRNGSVILKKFGAFYFKTHFDEWKQMQNNLTRKNQQRTF